MDSLDIDRFLDGFTQDEIIEKPVEVEKEEKTDDLADINLDFEKDIADKLNILKSKGEEKSDILVDIYNIITRFDEKLPNKISTINNTSSEILRTVSFNYSSEFLKNNKKQIGYLENKITDDIKLFRKSIEDENLILAKKYLLQIKKNLNLIPKSFFNKKIIFENKIHLEELKYLDFLDNYKNKKSNELNDFIKNKMTLLKQNLKVRNLKDSESLIFEIKNYIESLPIELTSIISQEKIKIIKVVNYLENLLLKLYRDDFAKRYEDINSLSAKFHKYYLKKDIEKTLLIYNEIVIEFENLPEVFLEKKLEIYNNIQEIYSKINKLLINNNVEMFLNSYNNSRKVENIKEYLKQVSLTKNVDLNHLNELKEDVLKLPNNYESEKTELQNKINLILKNKILIENKKVNLNNNDNNIKNKLNQLISKTNQFDEIDNNDKKITEVKKEKLNREIHSFDKPKKVVFEKKESLNKPDDIIQNIKDIKFVKSRKELKENIFYVKEKLQKLNLPAAKKKFLESKLKKIYTYKIKEFIQKEKIVEKNSY